MNRLLTRALLAYAAVYRVFGIETVAFHAVNIVLNAIAATAFFLFLDGIGYRLRVSLLAATLFAVHPLRVQSVAWAAERKDVLAALFWMLTLLAYHAYVVRPTECYPGALRWNAYPTRGGTYGGLSQ